MPETIWHDLEDINGIGPSLAEQMRFLRYHNTEFLLRSPPFEVARDLEPIDGLNLENVVTQIIPQAALLRLSDISVEAMHVFHENRIYHGRLAYGDTQSHLSLLSEAGVEAEPSEVQKWQLSAANLINKTTIMLRVLDADNTPVEGADIYVTDPPKIGDDISWRWQSREDGWAMLEYLMSGTHEIVVVKNDRFSTLRLSVGVNEHLCLTLRLTGEASNGVLYDERTDGISLMRRSWIRRSADSLEDFVNGELFELTALGEETARLSTLLRHQEGASWVVTSVQVPLSDFAAEVSLGQVYRWEDEAFTFLEGTATEIRRGLRAPQNEEDT